MGAALQRLDSNYETLKRQHGVTGTHYCLGETKNITPVQFAEEANVVMEAYMTGKVQPLVFNDRH